MCCLQREMQVQRYSTKTVHSGKRDLRQAFMGLEFSDF